MTPSNFEQRIDLLKGERRGGEGLVRSSLSDERRCKLIKSFSTADPLA